MMKSTVFSAILATVLLSVAVSAGAASETAPQIATVEHASALNPAVTENAVAGLDNEFEIDTTERLSRRRCRCVRYRVRFCRRCVIRTRRVCIRRKGRRCVRFVIRRIRICRRIVCKRWCIRRRC
eukprot:IDg2623t1